MVMAYQETPEDRALTAAFRWYDGQRIDVRWAGGWLTPDGEYYPVDYKNGITHESIADEHGSLIWGSGSITTRPPVMRLFDIAGWIRIAYMEYSTFCVELKGHFHNCQSNRQNVLIEFILNQPRFESYYVNDTRYDNRNEIVSAIIADRVSPKRADPKLEGEASKMGVLRRRRGPAK